MFYIFRKSTMLTFTAVPDYATLELIDQPHDECAIVEDDHNLLPNQPARYVDDEIEFFYPTRTGHSED